jgi:hypothetical protein
MGPSSAINDAGRGRTTPTSGKKLNPCSVSSTDCHTCKSRGRRCDRQSPHCSRCISLAVKCGGFETPLLWRRRGHNILSSTQSKTRGNRSSTQSSATDLEADPITPTQPTSPASMNDSAPFRRFTFVDGRKSKRHKRLESNSGKSKASSSETQEDVTLQRQDSPTPSLWNL